MTLLIAEDECRKAGSFFVGTEHLFLAIAEESNADVEAILAEHDCSLESAIANVKHLIRRWDPGDSWNGLLQHTPRVKRIADKAKELCDGKKPDASHFLKALMLEPDSHTVRALLNKRHHPMKRKSESSETTEKNTTSNKESSSDGIDMSFTPAGPDDHPQKRPRGHSALDHFGRDLTELAREKKLPPSVARESELNLIVRTLSRQTKPNAMIIGDPGTGKTALVEQLAQKIADGKAPKFLAEARIVELSFGTLISGTQYRGDFEQRIEAILAETAADPNVILFLDEFHLAVGAGAAGTSNIDAANVLKPALARGDMRCIAATTLREYRKHIEPDDALTRRFQTVMINQPTDEETFEILKARRRALELHHGVIIPDEALQSCISMSNRFESERKQPDKSIDLLDDACSRVAMSDPNDTKVPTTAIQHIAEAVADRTGVPVENLVTSDRERLANLKNVLCESIHGQEPAIDAVVAVLREIRMGLRDDDRPNGVLLFTGPTGVGKTFLAEILAKTFYDLDEAMIRIDMSEYTDAHSVSRLIGAPPGYIGHDEQGQLTNALRARPYSLVLLDEVEKAHPQIFDIFLQVFGSGRLTDGRGDSIDCRQAMFVMTSNLGSDAYFNEHHFGLRAPEAGDDGREERDKAIMEEIRRYFRPEFLNRIDRAICFDPISKDTMRTILDKMIDELLIKLKARDIELEIPPDVRDHLVKQAGSKQGVPALTRKLKQEVTNQAIAKLVESSLDETLKLKAMLKDGEIELESV